MVEQGKCVAHTAPNALHLEPLLGTPAASLRDLGRIELEHLQEVVEKPCYQKFTVAHLAPIPTARAAKIIAYLQVVEEKTGRGGEGNCVGFGHFLTVGDQVKEVFIV